MAELYTESIERIAIDSANAAIGMYVAKLDRPWLETPFVFQGFEIRDREEIEMLQAYCGTIYVDVRRGQLTAADVKKLMATRSARAVTRVEQRGAPQRRDRRLSRWLTKLAWRTGLPARFRRESRLEADGYPITTTVRAEAPVAFSVCKAVFLAYRQLVDEVRGGGTVPGGLVRKTLGPLIDSILRNPDAMAWTIFSRRHGGQAVSRAVATSVWCVMFGRHLGFDRPGLEDLAVGGLLLDIGNTKLPPELVNQRGELSREQRALAARHVEFGLEILERSRGVSANVLDMVAHHHERADGSGYPGGISGGRIPFYGRMAAIADCYDAMTTENAYSPAYPAYEVARTLNEMRGKQFDEEVVEQFLRTVGVFPTASVVELNNGMIGLVIEQNRSNALRPKVMLALDANQQPLPKPKIVEMRDLPPDATHANAVWIATGHEHGAFGIDPADFFRPGGRD